MPEAHSEEDALAFETYRRQQQLKQAAVVTAIIGLGAGLFWPADFITFADSPALLAAFAHWRLRVVITASVTLVLLRVLRAHPLAVVALVNIAGAAALLFVSYALGGLEDAQHLWFAYFFIAPFAAVPMTLSWPERLAMAVSIPGACFVGFYAAVQSIDPSRVLVDIVFMAFATFSAVVIGHLVTGLTRANFMNSRALLTRTHALEESDRAKSQLLANVSHELRTPLTLILAGFRQMDQHAGEAALVRQSAAMGRKNAARLLLLINELLDLSAYDAGRRPSKRTVDVAGEIRRTVGAFGSVPERSVDVHGAGDALLAEVDPLALKKVLYNLLSNAFKFTRKGGQIVVSLQREASRFAITVKDDGCGIPEEEQARIFERFVRLEGRDQLHEGTGIGLALVRQIVEAHGGTVRLVSRANEGAAFTVEMPIGGPAHDVSDESDDGLSALLKDAESAARARNTQAMPAPEGAPTLLVVDDNEDIRDSLSRALGARYRVVTAVDGEEGLEKARALRPALVLTDGMMPKMDGRALVQAMRADASLASTPVLMLSARAATTDRVEMLRVGANDYVVKPFEEEELFARIDNLLLLRAQREVIAAHNETLEETVREKTAELHSLAEHLLKTRELERAHISRELHDELGGLFTAMRFETDALSENVSTERLLKLLERSLHVMRSVVADLRPAALDELGFLPAIEQLFSGFEARTGVACLWEVDPPDLVLHGEQALVAYRVLQESLTNVARHARAKSVEVRVSLEDDVKIEITDDGVGLPADRKGFGLLGMRERVQSLGGRAVVERALPRGTRVLVRFPL
jgi:signal transduction histidine kinase